MNQIEAEKIANDLWPGTFRLEKTPKGSCRVLRSMTEAEKNLAVDSEERKKLKLSSDGLVILAIGKSWREALRYAAKPRIDELNAEKEKRQNELRAQEREAQVRLNLFQDFLLKKYEIEFETWVKNGQSFEPKAPDADATPVAASPAS